MGNISVLKSVVVPKIMLKAANLPVIALLPDSHIKKINQVLFKFIWESKWKKIGGSQLCCDIVDRGAKMNDIKQNMLALQFKEVVKSFEENNTAAWKTLENLCIDENLFCILRSNIKMTNMMITKLAFLRFTRCTLLALRFTIDVSQIFCDNKFLWLNKAVKYQNNPMLIKHLLFVE